MNLLKNKPTVKRYVVQSVVAVAVIAFMLVFDLVTKAVVEGNMAVGDSVPVIPNFFYITFIYNDGAAWGMTVIMPLVITLTFIALAAFLLLLFFPDKRKNMLFIVAMAMVTAGATGNLIDRLYLGQVRDFLNFFIFGYDFPVFNIADVSLVVGVILLVVFLIICLVKALSQSKKEKAKGATDGASAADNSDTANTANSDNNNSDSANADNNNTVAADSGKSDAPSDEGDKPSDDGGGGE